MDDILAKSKLQTKINEVKLLDHIDSGKCSKEELANIAKHFVKLTTNLSIANQELQLQVTNLTYDNMYNNNVIVGVYYVPQ
jgi:hypothetical protein